MSLTDPQYLNHRVVEDTGEVIGTITDVVFDPHSGDARWAVVKPGLLHRSHYMPLEGAYRSETGDVVVTHRKATVTHAPVVSSNHVLSDEDERNLRQHYA